MELLKEIISMCKGSVTVQVNPHKDYYQNAKKYLDDLLEHRDVEIDEEVLNGIREKDILVIITAYPDTPVGSYSVFHHDLDAALAEMKQSLIENN